MNKVDVRANLRSLIAKYIDLFDTFDECERSSYIYDIIELSPDPAIMDYIGSLSCFDDDEMSVPYDEIEKILDMVMLKEPNIIYL